VSARISSGPNAAKLRVCQALGAAFLLGSGWSSFVAAQQGAGLLVSLDGDTLHVEAAGACEPLAVRATLQNMGETTLELGEPQPSCGCSRAELEARTLEPGETTQLIIDINPPNKEETELHESVSIAYGAPGDTERTLLDLSLVGTAIPCALLETVPVIFQNVVREEGETTPIERELRLFEGGRDAEFTFEATSPAIHASLKPGPDADRRVVAVSVEPDGVLGLRHETLRIAVNGHAFEEIPVSWQGESRLLRPERIPILFGRVQASEPKALEVPLGLAEGWRVASIASDSEEFVVINAEEVVASGGATVPTVRAQPTAQGEGRRMVEGALHVRLESAEQTAAAVELSIPMRCLALP
jgi:hypothetical protein